MPHRLLKITLALAGLIIALIVGEFFLRLLPAQPENAQSVWKLRMPSNLRKVLRPNPKLLAGLHNPSVFTTNSQGLRGEELLHDHHKNILAVGGSTTECLFLDDSRTWPQLTQEKMRRQGYAIRMANAGRAGYRLAEYYEVARYFLDRYPWIETLVVLTGVNDFQYALGHAPPEGSVGDNPNLFTEAGPTELAAKPFYKKLALWRLALGIRRKFYEWVLAEDSNGKKYEQWRKKRSLAANKIDTLPDLSAALQSYEEDIRKIKALAEQRGVRIIFMTQPTIWRNDLWADEEKLLWFGFAGGSQETATRYFTTAALAQGMALYNQTLLDWCRRENAECLDLAAKIPKTTGAFYDDCHLNEGGAEKVSDLLVAYLKGSA